MSVSVIFPANDIENKIALLRKEKTQTSNTKDRTIAKLVDSCLDKLIYQLQIYKPTTTNGIIAVAYCGDREGISVWESPISINANMFWSGMRCIHDNVLIYLEKITKQNNILYGYIIFDGTKSTCYLTNGTAESEKEVSDSYGFQVKRSHMGGSSQKRYNHINQNIADNNKKRVSEAVKDGFIDENGELLVNKIIIFTSGTASDVANKLLSIGVKQTKIKTIQTNLEQITKNDIYEKLTEVIYEDSIFYDKALINKFYKYLEQNEAKVVLGIKNIFSYLNNPLKIGNIRQILLHKSNGIYISKNNTILESPEKGSIDFHSWIMLETSIGSKLCVLNTCPADMDMFLKMSGCAILLHMEEIEQQDTCIDEKKITVVPFVEITIPKQIPLHLKEKIQCIEYKKPVIDDMMGKSKSKKK